MSPPNLVVWSVSVQLGAAALIALFFGVLAQTIRLREAKLWALAWFMETLAVGSVLITLHLAASVPGPIFRLPLAAFCTFKLLFAAFFVLGIRRHFLPRLGPGRNLMLIVGISALWGSGLAVLVPEPVTVLPLQWFAVAVLLIFGGISALRGMEGRAQWLGWILLGEGVLFLGYVPILAPVLWGEPPLFDIQSYSSLIDAGADVLLGLATLVALDSSSYNRLARLNAELQKSHDQLRHLAENDSLTGLINRRGSEPVLDAARHSGAALIFLDIDGFKGINDRHGHSAGDACLVRLAETLRREFRAEDQQIRWGGDEFLVVAPGLDLDSAMERVQRIRGELAKPPRGDSEGVLSFSVSVGVALLQKGQDPADGLQEADQRMYFDKRRLAARLRV